MNTAGSLQSEALALLGRLKAKKEQIEDECKRRIQEVDAEIQAVSTTLRLLGEARGTGRITEPGAKTLEVPASQLVGKSAREALIEIAKQNGGLVRIVDAKPLLLAAGVLRPTKNTWGAIFTTLRRSREFEKVPDETGTFRLLQDSNQEQLAIQ